MNTDKSETTEPPLQTKTWKGWIRLQSIVVKLIRNVSFPIRFLIFCDDFGVHDGPRRKEEIIVSLTSFPARMPKLHLCLKSLLLQKVRPDRIILWLAEDEMSLADVPAKVSDLTRYGLEIRFCDNLKPHNKYFNVMRQFPDATTITVDDDKYYSPELVGDLVAGHERRPEDVICTRAHRITVRDGAIQPYRKWEYETKKRQRASHDLMATGAGGVLYPAHCLPPETFDAGKIRRLCLKADDVWLKAMEILNGTKVFALRSTHTKYMTGIFGSGKQSLRKENVGMNMNDRYVSDVFGFYGITPAGLAD